MTIWAVYFSATGTTARVVQTIAQELARLKGCALQTYDFTLPAAREQTPTFAPDDLVVFGTPVYAGRVPNLLLPYLRTFVGGGAAAVPVVLFGNRDFDDALIELRDLLTADGFAPIAAGAFVGTHAFSETLGAGRPDESDLQQARQLAALALRQLPARQPVVVDGVPAPYRGYYQPRDRAGKPIDIRRVKPKTAASCDRCGRCAAVCPMGAIDAQDCTAVPGICIKCGACVKKCHKQAKYYDDAGYLYHKTELELGYARRAANSLFPKGE